MKKFWVIGGSAVVVAAVAAAGVVLATRDTGPSVTTATVTAVVAGDVLTVELDGTSHTLELLDIDAPSEAAGECLAFESTQQLGAFAPVGATLSLEVDGVALDAATAEGTIQAVAIVEDGRTVSELMAREGLAYLPADASAGEYRYDVQRAQELARTEGLGLYSTDVDCTIPAQVLVVAEEVELAPLSVAAGTPRETLTAQRTEITEILDGATALVEVVNGPQTGAIWDVLRSSDRIGYTAQAAQAVARLEVANGQLEAALGGSGATATAQG